MAIIFLCLLLVISIITSIAMYRLGYKHGKEHHCHHQHEATDLGGKVTGPFKQKEGDTRNQPHT